MAEANEDKLIELHFYFVSIRNIYKYIAKIIEQDSALLPLKDEFEALNQQWLLHNSKGREAFEHIDQRLHGEKHEDRLVEVDGRAIHYGLRWEERTFVHSDMSWDISLETFQKLREKLSNFMDKLDDVHSI